MNLLAAGAPCADRPAWPTKMAKLELRVRGRIVLMRSSSSPRFWTVKGSEDVEVAPLGPCTSESRAEEIDAVYHHAVPLEGTDVGRDYRGNLGSEPQYLIMQRE
jgi:hypothetical protein